MSRTALITGIAGQDGSYLAEHLVRLGYQVHGTHRPGRTDFKNLNAVQGRVTLRPWNVCDRSYFESLIRNLQPDEIYHLAAQTSVAESWMSPVDTLAANVNSVAIVLDAVLGNSPSSRVFVAGSSEQFSGATDQPQNERTECSPRNPYGVSKVAASQLVESYRRGHGLFACTGILFNHESPRRPKQFVSRKISSAVAEIANGKRQSLSLGNVGAIRDWGFTGDYVVAMHKMLCQEYPRDLVLATGVGASVLEFALAAFQSVGIDEHSAKQYLKTESSYGRIGDAVSMIGDPLMARDVLGWEASVKYDQLAAMMTAHDSILLSYF